MAASIEERPQLSEKRSSYDDDKKGLEEGIAYEVTEGAQDDIEKEKRAYNVSCLILC